MYVETSVDEPTLTVSKIQLHGTDYMIADHVSREEIEELKKKINGVRYIKLNCQNCGAPLTNKIEDHIVKCKFCHTAYFIGTDTMWAV